MPFGRFLDTVPCCVRLGRDRFKSNRRRALDLCWRTIFSASRCPPIGSSPRACFSGSCSTARTRKSASKKTHSKIIYKSDREPTDLNSCAKLKLPKHLSWSRRSAALPGLSFPSLSMRHRSMPADRAPPPAPQIVARATRSQRLRVSRRNKCRPRTFAGCTLMSIGDVNSMSKEEGYRLTAAEIVECARQAKSVIEKRRLLRLAEMWLDLAVRSSRKTTHVQRRIEDHPLVRKTLGSGPAGVS
jgi:hypothetical protein